jgi:hypothetical protein
MEMDRTKWREGEVKRFQRKSWRWVERSGNSDEMYSVSLE